MTVRPLHLVGTPERFFTREQLAKRLGVTARVFGVKQGRVRTLVLLGVLVMPGCRYITAHVPATCVAPTLDTLRVVQNAAGDTLALEVRHGCAIWQALDDSTKRWDSAGRRLPTLNHRAP